MKFVEVENNDVIGAINKLIECKTKGEYGVLEFSEFDIATTDDIPDKFKSMEFEAVWDCMCKATSERSYKLKGAKLGFFGEYEEVRNNVINYEQENSQDNVK